MLDLNSNRKKIYDATANLILDLHLQRGTISKEEMHCLLSILDLVMMGKKDFGLLELLQEWEASPPELELSEIVKVTLLNLDFSQLESQQRNIDTIRELLRYNRDLRDRTEPDIEQ